MHFVCLAMWGFICSNRMLEISVVGCCFKSGTEVGQAEENPHWHREMQTWKSPRPRIEPTTFFLCGDSANYNTSVIPTIQFDTLFTRYNIVNKVSNMNSEGNMLVLKLHQLGSTFVELTVEKVLFSFTWSDKKNRPVNVSSSAVRQELNLWLWPV